MKFNTYLKYGIRELVKKPTTFISGFAICFVGMLITFNMLFMQYGASGLGKSTLLHLLAALERPDSGELWIDGKEIYALNEKQMSSFRNTEIGFVFQNYHLLPVLTAKENILMPALISGKPASGVYLSELCDALGLTDRLDHLPNQLSGGQQQRVAIARAMINRPKLIFADEPTGNLDKGSAEELIEMLLLSAKRFEQTDTNGHS